MSASSIRSRGAPTVLVTAVGGAEGRAAAAAALACAGADVDRAALLVDVGGRPPRPTLLASAAARGLEERLAAHLPSARVAARGQVCHLAVARGSGRLRGRGGRGDGGARGAGGAPRAAGADPADPREPPGHAALGGAAARGDRGRPGAGGPGRAGPAAPRSGGRRPQAAAGLGRRAPRLVRDAGARRRRRPTRRSGRRPWPAEGAQ